MFGIDDAWILPIAGMLAGFAMGYVARRNHFCTMAALERHWYAADSNGLRAWVLAAAVALTLTQALVLSGTVDLSGSFYLTTAFGLTGAVAGGLMFGIGMALVGTCGFGAVVRLGGGSLRAAVVLTGIALAALAAQRGLVAQLRVLSVDNLAIDLGFAGDQSLGSIASAFLGFDARLPIAAAVATLLYWWVFSDSAFRRDRGKMAAGIVIGVAVAFGWLVTATLQARLMVPVQIEAGSFVVPVGDTIMQIITVTGLLPDYGVGLVVGVFIGAASAAFLADDVRWEACDDARELGRHLLGAFLMGTGGVFAMGCTIGQGVSAFSLLAISAPIVVLSIAFGARIGLGLLVEGSAFSFLRNSRHEPAE